MLDKGADIVFTMLNGARQGTIEACRKKNVSQIGNALNWCQMEPDVFIGSAIARIDLGVMQAIADMVEHKSPDHIVEFGLQTPRQGEAPGQSDAGYVSLAIADYVSKPVCDLLELTTRQLGEGTIRIPGDYAGPEFTLEAEPCI